MTTFRQARAVALGLTVFLSSLTGCQTSLPTNHILPPANHQSTALPQQGAAPYGLQSTSEFQQMVTSEWTISTDFDCFSSSMQGGGSAGCQHDKLPSYMGISIPGAQWFIKSRRDVWGSEILPLNIGFDLPQGATLKKVHIDYSYHGWGIRGYDLSGSSDFYDLENNPQQATLLLLGEKEESTPPSRQTLTLEGDKLQRPDGSPIEGLRFFVAGHMTDPAFIGKVTVDYISSMPTPSPTPGLNLTCKPSFTPEWDGINDWASIDVTVPTSSTSWLLTANAHPIAAGTGDSNVTWFGMIGKSFKGNGVYKLELSASGQTVSRSVEIINGPRPFKVRQGGKLWATAGDNFGNGLPDGRNETFGARVRRAGEKEEEVGWGRPKTWNMDNLAKHYEKHVKVRGEFGKIDEVAYWTKAERICEVGDGPRHVTNGVLKGTRFRDNYTIYLQEEQGAIVFVDEIGYIQGMFKPGFRKGISAREQKKLARDYFNKEVDRLIE